MEDNFLKIKEKIIKIGKRMYDKGFVPGCSGNISFKIEDKIIITSSGCCLGDLTENDLVETDLDGKLQENKREPSSEKYMHTEIYKKRPDIRTILHAHPPKSTSMAVAGFDLRQPLIAEAVVLLGEIPLIDYQTPSSSELAEKISNGFIDHDAVLMANHGVTVCGNDLEKTYYKLETIEFSSEIFLTTAQIGKQNPIPKKKIRSLKRIREKLEL